MAAGWFTDTRNSRDSETDGRHSTTNATLPVAVLLRRVVATGQAVRLAWSVEGNEQPTEPGEWPTAVLPRVREAADELPARDRASWF